jgi:Replication-relaxation
MSRRYLTAAAYRAIATQVVARDLAVLQCLAELRFVTGGQLTRRCFADDPDPAVSGRAARRALLRLVRLGLLARLPRQVGGVRAGSAGFVYHLGPSGQRLSAERGWQPEQRRRRSLTPGTLFLQHSLAIAELHTQLVEADRSRRFELLELTAEPSCWRSYDGLGNQRTSLKPDSYVRLGLGDYEHSYFLEIDRGTEGWRTIVRQLTSYTAYYLSGQEQTAYGVFPQALWLAPDERRVEAIAACIERLPSADQVLFQVARFDEALTLMTASAPDSGLPGI